jgi:hypothetical protein
MEERRGGRVEGFFGFRGSEREYDKRRGKIFWQIGFKNRIHQIPVGGLPDPVVGTNGKVECSSSSRLKGLVQTLHELQYLFVHKL